MPCAVRGPCTGLGDTDKNIATVDADGVTLGAARALARRTAKVRR